MMRSQRLRRLGVGAVVAAALIAPAAQAVSLGQSDTFEDGTTQGWGIGSGSGGPAAPANVGTGGPAGDGDGYLKLTSLGGSGPGSRLVAFNNGQWTGDFLTAGISALRMDLRNFGPTALTIGLALNGSVSTRDVHTLDAGGDWQTVTFSLSPADLVPGGDAANSALGNVTQLRIFHGEAALGGGLSFPGPAMVASLGVDNVTAVPEPETWVMLATGALLVGFAAVRRRM